MNNSQLCTGLAALVFALSAGAQNDFEAWKRQQEQGANQIQEDFRKFKDENDRQFADFLKAQWREFDAMRGVVRDPKPKPKVLPTAKPAPTEKPVRPALRPTMQPSAIPVPSPSPKPPIIATPRPAAGEVVRIDFYGHLVAIPALPAWRQNLRTGSLSAESMSEFWTRIGTSNFEPALAQLQLARKTLALDDWSYLTLTRRYVETLQPTRVTDQNLLLWFLLIKSGFDVRCAYMDDQLYVFVAVAQQVYGTKFLQVKDIPYYAVLAADRGQSMKAFYTYDARYPGDLRPVDLRVRSLAFTRAQAATRELNWSHAGQKYRVVIPYDRQAIDFLKSYPQVDIRVPFSSDLSPLSRAALLRELRPLLAGMNEEQSVNFLLAFVQKAFAYRTDEDQFGYEKYFFGEEILFYPYSDCEDRSVFFAWLVHELTGLDVVGLSYPGHIATAVRFKYANPSGDTIAHKGQRYVVADPTYIGAGVGMSQPAFRRSSPSVISW